MIRLLLDLFKNKNFLKVHNNRFKIVIIFLALAWYSTSGYLYYELPSKPDLSWSDSIWWTLVTMTTVGYGDFFPSTSLGRYMVGIPTMIFGIGFLGFIISSVASELIESRSRRLRGMAQLTCGNHILIINFYNMESIISLIDEFRNDSLTSGKEICLIDEDLMEIPMELEKLGVHFVHGNPSNENILFQANVEKASHAIVLSKDPSDDRSDDSNISNVLVVKSLAPSLPVIVEVVNSDKISQINLAGANSVVCVSEFTANLVVQELQDPGVKEILGQLTSNRYGQQIYITTLEKKGQKNYRDLIEWGVSENYSIMGIFRNDIPLINCNANEMLNDGDRIIYIGEKRKEKIELS